MSTENVLEDEIERGLSEISEYLIKKKVSQPNASDSNYDTIMEPSPTNVVILNDIDIQPRPATEDGAFLIDDELYNLLEIWGLSEYYLYFFGKLKQYKNLCLNKNTHSNFRRKYHRCRPSETKK